MINRTHWTDYVITCLTRFCLGAVAAMLLYLQAGLTEPYFLAVVCLLLLPAVGTVLLEAKAMSPAKQETLIPVLFYTGELLLLLTAFLPGAAAGLLSAFGSSWPGVAEGAFSDGAAIGVERNSLLLGSLVQVLPSMLSAGGSRRNLLDRPVAAEGILFLTAYLWAVWSEAGYGYRFFLYALSVLFLLFYFYRKNQVGRHSFFEAAGSQIAEGQEEYARQVNRRSLLPFLLLVLLVSVLVWIPIGSQALTETVQEGYSGVMSGLNDWLTGMPEDFAGMFGEPQQEEAESEPDLQENGEGVPEPVQEESDLWLLKALIQGAMIVLTFLAVGVLFLILRRVSEKEENKSQNEVQQDYEITVTEKSTRLETKHRERRKISDNSPENRRIRQVYYEVIRKRLAEAEGSTERQPKGLDKRKLSGTKVQEKSQGRDYQTMVPEELEYQAGIREDKKQSGTLDRTSQEASVELLHRLYEKARYGREACSREEQRQAEEAANHL